jgi:hypothetical protein
MGNPQAVECMDCYVCLSMKRGIRYTGINRDFKTGQWRCDACREKFEATIEGRLQALERAVFGEDGR